MAMGFAVIPFILSVLGIGISGYQAYKQHNKEKEEKITNTYDNIKKQKEELTKEYENLNTKMESKINDEQKEDYLQAVNNFISNKETKLQDSLKSKDSTGKTYSYISIITAFGINNEVDRLREIKAEIRALNAIEGKDLRKIKLKEISKELLPGEEFPDSRARNAVIAKLMTDKQVKRGK